MPGIVVISDQFTVIFARNLGTACPSEERRSAGGRGIESNQSFSYSKVLYFNKFTALHYFNFFL